MSKRIRGVIVLGLVGVFMLCSCSTNLGPETLPSTTPATEPTETIPEVTEPTEEPTPTEAPEPTSTAVITDRIVDKNGLLKVDGTKIVNSEEETVVLKGMSSFGLEDCEGFFTSEIVKTLAEDWGCDVLRIVISGDETSDGYLYDPDKYFDMVCKICDMCIDQGIYVIVDWDVLYTNDYDDNLEQALFFFQRLSTIYPESVNVIYEVNNYTLSAADTSETDDEEDDEEINEWEDIIKPFASEVIEAIRDNAPDSIIIIGAPGNGLEINIDPDSKLDYDNIVYGCRVFSGTHKQEQRDTILEAIDNDLCVFITEWSFCTDDTKGGIFTNESRTWSGFLDENEISWCNFAIGSEIDNDTNALNLHSDKYTLEQKYSGHWPDGLISNSGLYARDLLLEVNTEDAVTDTDTDAGTDTDTDTDEPEQTSDDE
ncbi:MAG: cellulase family glycosylhydrolase [Clostridiales bacterium]|nr:cellulase family glycosylhydrolase [Clostridiales bacterium]